MQGDGLLESVLRGGPPDVTDGECEGVGGVGRLGRGAEPQQAGDHGTDLCLVGAARAGHGGLDLAGGVQRDGDAAAGGAEHGDGAGLGGAHHGADVVLAEHPLHGDEFGLVLVQPHLDALLDGDEAVAQLGVRGRPYDTDAEHGERASGDAFDHTDTASRQPRVHPQYAHPAPPPLFAAKPPPLSRTWLSAAWVPQLLVATRGRRSLTLARLSAATDKSGGPMGCVPSARSKPLSSRPRYASTFSMISSLTSKLAKTFCTSSLSSSASISLKIFLAPSSSSSTWTDGTKLESAES